MKKITQNLIYTLFLFFAISLSGQQQEIFVAPYGNDNASGECDEPLATLKAAVDKSRADGIKKIWIKEGRYFFDETIFLDGRDQGLFISGYEDDRVIFDGGTVIDAKGFTTVKNNLGGRIKNAVVRKIYSTKINASDIQKLLESPEALVTFNDNATHVSRYPNLGFSVFRKETVKKGFEQVNKEGTHQNPVGPVFKLFDPFDSYNVNAWENEIKRHKKIQMTGYTSAAWLRESNFVATTKRDGNFIRLVNGTAYGIENREVNRRKNVVFSNILYEIDEPGEWFYDEIEKKLYMYPYTPIEKDSRITIAAGPQLLFISDTKDITIERLTIQNLGKGKNGDGAINVRKVCDNINIAGIVFKNIAKPLASFNFYNDVKNSSVKSCDFIDVEGVRFYGGSYGKNFVIPGNNVLENCHFTRVYRTGPFRAGSIKGAGNTFRNNLIHNSTIQPFTFYGVEHLIEQNEVFNVGTEEGDGGSMYGGNALFTFNNTFRHNFFHHLMTQVGTAFGRGGIHFDDFDAGDFTFENVFYRGGAEAVKMGNGGQHKVMRNIIMRSPYAIKNGSGRNVDTDPLFVNNYKSMMDFINNDPESGKKQNYIGRALKVAGRDGWQNGLNENNWVDRFHPWWLARYPRFGQLMRDYFRSKKPLSFGCEYKNNFFHDNENSFKLNKGNVPAEISGNREISTNIFTDVSTLDFSYNGKEPSYMPKIPFNRIGLYKDKYRCAVPKKAVYRKAVKDFFAGRKMSNVPYDPKTVNGLTYINSGLIATSTVPCTDFVINSPLESYELDLGTPTSPVFNDYLRVSNNTNELEYGWLNPDILRSTDRGAGPGVNNLNRDIVFSKEPNTFEAVVKNGKWKVLITFGDANFRRDRMQVKAEGKVMLSDVTAEAGNFINRDFNVLVTDGRLTLEFSDQGGDPTWVATRIVLSETEGEVDCPLNCLDEIDDDDGDGVCNINDVCPDGDDTIDTNNNGIPDACDGTLSTDSFEENKIQVYPNPAKEQLNIKISNITDAELSLAIIDITGRIIYSKANIENDSTGSLTTINTNSWNSGVYFLNIKKSNTNEVIKIIIN